MRRVLARASIFVVLVVGASSLAAAYEVITVTNGGTVQGVVKLAGAAPTVPAIKTTKNQDYCGNSIDNPLYLVGKDGGLKNVEVFLKGIDKGKANPTGTITLLNTHCMFDPRVQGSSVGQQIKIASDDPILLCPCGSSDVEVLAGTELLIKAVEVRPDVRDVRV